MNNGFIEFVRSHTCHPRAGGDPVIYNPCHAELPAFAKAMAWQGFSIKTLNIRLRHGFDVTRFRVKVDSFSWSPRLALHFFSLWVDNLLLSLYVFSPIFLGERKLCSHPGLIMPHALALQGLPKARLSPPASKRGFES